jgi:hypothetical protein
MSPEPLRIVHITDTHIIAEPGAEVYGVDSFAALESLLAVMQRDAWTPHLLIATGDLSEDGSVGSYQRLRSLLTSLGLPVYCIPGNHDVLSQMHAHLQGGPISLEHRIVWEALADRAPRLAGAGPGAWLSQPQGTHRPGGGAPGGAGGPCLSWPPPWSLPGVSDAPLSPGECRGLPGPPGTLSQRPWGHLGA